MSVGNGFTASKASRSLELSQLLSVTHLLRVHPLSNKPSTPHLTFITTRALPVQAIVFMAALSAYDSVLFEDETVRHILACSQYPLPFPAHSRTGPPCQSQTNRMEEALALFDHIVNLR